MSPKTRRYIPILIVLLVVGLGLLLAPPERLRGAAAEAGCTPQDLVANEKAKAEGRYVALETIAVMGAALGITFQYGEATTSALVAQSQGQVPSSAGCYQLAVEESNGVDGSGKVSYDFNSCTDQQGRLVVSQGPVLVEAEVPEAPGGESGARDEEQEGGIPGWPEGLPEGLPEDVIDQLPDGFPEDLSTLGEEDLMDLLTSMTEGSASTAVTVSYEDFANGPIHIHGAMTLGTKVEFSELVEGGQPANQSNPAELVQGGLNRGQLSAAVTTSLFDFQGTAMLAGAVELDLENGTTQLNMGGNLRSVTGLDWEILINDLVIGTSCKGAVSGNINAIYDSPAGRVDVVASADGSCDGCLQLEIDGIEQEDLCLPDLPGLQL